MVTIKDECSITCFMPLSVLRKEWKLIECFSTMLRSLKGVCEVIYHGDLEHVFLFMCLNSNPLRIN